MDLKKKNFIEAYKKAFGIVSVAAKAASIERCTYYDWLKKDPEFKQAIEEIEPEEDFIDMAENALQKKIKEGDTTAIIFTLKTKGKKRGYIERKEITGADDSALKIEIDFKNATTEQLRALATKGTGTDSGSDNSGS
jgi:hypothetical protein